MAEFTKERIIEELKASTQNASGMFEISEDNICALMSMLTYAAPQLPQPAVPDMATVEKTYPDVQTNWQDAKMYAEGWNACRATMLQGAEPVSQAYTLRDGIAAIRSLGPIDAGKIQAERDALNEPTCWCHTCRPVTMNDARFVVCPDCGNKRCPHANDHRNTCTGSNEPGQEGSAYPAAPQQE